MRDVLPRDGLQDIALGDILKDIVHGSRLQDHKCVVVVGNQGVRSSALIELPAIVTPIPWVVCVRVALRHGRNNREQDQNPDVDQNAGGN